MFVLNIQDFHSSIVSPQAIQSSVHPLVLIHSTRFTERNTANPNHASSLAARAKQNGLRRNCGLAVFHIIFDFALWTQAAKLQSIPHVEIHFGSRSELGVHAHERSATVAKRIDIEPRCGKENTPKLLRNTATNHRWLQNDSEEENACVGCFVSAVNNGVNQIVTTLAQNRK